MIDHSHNHRYDDKADWQSCQDPSQSLFLSQAKDKRWFDHIVDTDMTDSHQTDDDDEEDEDLEIFHESKIAVD